MKPYQTRACRVVPKVVQLFARVATLLVTIGTLPVSAQTFDEAVTAFVRGDFATALRGFRLAAEQGHAAAQSNLGIMYATGKGVSENHAEAVRWFRLAAKQGHAGARSNLGAMYATGQGISENDAEEVRALRFAAERGIDVAQFALALRYATGRGVPENHAEAVRWFHLAAEQGYSDAQMLLESMDDKDADSSADGSDAQRNSSREIELYLAARISETLDKPKYSVLKRCDPEMIWK